MKESRRPLFATFQLEMPRDSVHESPGPLGIAYPPFPITDNAFFNGAGEICTAPSSGRFISRIK